ncbi:isopeptide-forming domain-containing fimbrial protein [Microbacterium sp. NPDC090003]|uniref:DUF7507 domain-containing protein n=1 Tax=Microbacterium sp. NPDC090003 TaxID=3364203 RepID=UPI0037F5A0C0
MTGQSRMPSRLRTAAIAMLATLATVTMMFVAAPAAYAAGPAQLSIELTPINPGTGETVTTTGYNQQNNRLGYRIAYSCSVAECTDAVVTLPAVALDPTYGTFRIHRYETWTPPAGGGATITNSVTGGVTVRLGDVAAGTSSTFLVQYVRDIDTSAPGVTAPAYFPNGYQIQNSATITSPNAVAPVTASAPPVTWQIALPANPTIAKTGPTTVRPDTDMTYSIAMSDGCFTNRGSGRWTAAGNLLCGESYTVVDHLPVQAQFVSAGDGGVYDEAAHTVTWTKSGATAAGGFGVTAFSGWSQGYGYNPRTVTVRYPASAFPEAADGADFVVPVTNNVDVSVTYLDDAATVKTAANSFTHSVVRVQPFGRADLAKASTADQVAGGQRFVNVPPNTTGLVCPASGRDDWNRVCTPGQAVAPFTTRTDQYWTVDANNRGNVPAVATIVDDDLGDSTLRVYRIETNSAATIAYTLSNGTTGTATGTSYAAPTGQRIVAATVTSGQLAGPNLLPSGTAGTLFRVLYRYEVPVGAPLTSWANTATSTMTYTANPEIAPIVTEATGTATFREWPKVAAAAPAFNAGFIGTPVVEGGGLVVPGGKVTFGVAGSTANIPADRTVSPQYVFIAPVGWNVLPNSASFPVGAVPPGVSFTYKNVTIGGASRQAVIASWPTGATFGANVTWPTMSVSASPTSAVAAGTNSQASVWAGDSRNVFDPNATTWGGKVVDTTDIDGDGNTTEAFASSSTSVSVSGVARLDVVKEICVVTDDGCDWVSNPDVVVGVDPDASDITYRLTLVNSGNTVLSGIVGYDILPHVGDGRGSTFAETLNTVVIQSPNMSLSYSNSQNPCRAEVLPTNPGCTTGWAASASGAAAIRAQVSGNLAPGASSSFIFTANVVPGAPADAIACNSVAIDSASTLPAEPRPVCATTQEADLSVEVPDRLPLQAGRPGLVPFLVTNLGGSVNAPASVDIAVPAGIRITSLTPEGWVCEADDVAPDGSVLGPVTLTCDPVTADGASRMLALDEPNALNLPAVIPDDELVGEDACFGAEVSGLMSDPVDANNTTEACFVVAQGESLIGLTKTDGRDSVAMGEEFTYTIDVANLLTGEALADVVVTDTLPATLAFVSASAGGAVTDQGEADADGLRPGGTVTWNIASLAAAGRLGDGDAATGAEGSTQQVTVTVRVVQAAESASEIVNEAQVSAGDPALPGVTLTADDSDTDDLIRTAALSLEKTALPTTVDAVGDTVAYSFAVTNSGDVTVSDVQIDETAFSGTGTTPVVTCPAEAASLAPGAEITCTASYVVTQADLDAGTITNTAVATASALDGVEDPESEPSSATVTATAAPAISLVKEVRSENIVAAGDVVDYAFTVTNTGNVTVDAVDIEETAFTGTGDDVIPTCSDAPLAPGDSTDCTATYEVTQADVNTGRIDNTAVAHATSPTDVVVSSDPSSAPVLIDAAPGLTVVKTAAPTDLAVDEEVTYSFVVTNTGNVTLQGVAVVEGLFTGSGELSAVDCGDASRTLDPDDQLICEATYVITQDDVDAGELSNTATATGTAPGGPITSAPSREDLSFERIPGLAIVKTADVAGIERAGQEIEYRFRVTNTGNVTVSGVEIEEGAFSGTGELSEIGCETGSLLPGQHVDCFAAYEVTQDDVDAGGITNTASATASVFGDATVDADPSTSDLPFLGVLSLALEKVGTPVDVDWDDRMTVNDRIRWTFTVTNPSGATLSGLEVSDPMAGVVECEADVLAPGETVACAAVEEYQVTAAQAAVGEVVNVAVATASGAGDARAGAEATATVVVVAPAPAPPASADPEGPLATTGGDPGAATLVALLVMLVGAGLVVVSRRQRVRRG